MARYRGAVCRLCRREGQKLYLNGERCQGSSCAIESQNYPPGQHGQVRRKLSTYGLQLREKQKAKRTYGVLERQFRRYFKIADGYRGITGTILLQLLERRLDNIVYRLGFASSRASARQLVNHGHVLVNGQRVDVASYMTREGEDISLSEKAKKNPNVVGSLEMMDRQGRLPWLEYSNETMVGKIASVPEREEIPVDIKEQMIVELYSK